MIASLSLRIEFPDLMFRILPSNDGELLGLFSVVLDKIGKESEVRL